MLLALTLGSMLNVGMEKQWPTKVEVTTKKILTCGAAEIPKKTMALTKTVPRVPAEPEGLI